MPAARVKTGRSYLIPPTEMMLELIAIAGKRALFKSKSQIDIITNYAVNQRAKRVC